MSADRTRLSVMVAGYCQERRISVRTLAKQLNVSPATAHRIIIGKSMDAATLLKLLDWLHGNDRPTRAYA